MKLNIRIVETEQFNQNAYLVWKDGSTEAVLIDPGFDTEGVEVHLAREKLRLVAILNTHGHVDHIAGNAAMKAQHPAARLVIGHGDEIMLSDPTANLSAKWGFHIVSPPADQLVREGDALDFAGITWEVREIPGHSPGHVVYLVRLPNSVLVFGGDVLFAGGVGRTDFPGGNFPQLASAIRAKLYTLPDNTRVLPGHGPSTTVGEEKRSNSFVSAGA